MKVEQILKQSWQCVMQAVTNSNSSEVVDLIFVSSFDSKMSTTVMAPEVDGTSYKNKKSFSTSFHRNKYSCTGRLAA